MKNVIILSLMFVAVCSISCVTSQKATSYSVALTGVDKPSDIQKFQDILLVEDIKDDCEISYLYEDDLMSILWNVNTEVFTFALTNKSDYPIEIPWDDVSYFDWQGYEHKVIHKGIKYVNRNLSQLSTTVSQDSTIGEYLLPVAHIYNTSGFFNSSYRVKSLFPSYKNQSAADKSNLAGQTIRIKFPIIVDGNKKNYLFFFEINDIVVK